MLRRTYREDGKVKHQTLGNISHLPPDLVETIRLRLRGELPQGIPAGFQIARSLPHGHVAAVLATIRTLGLDRIIASRRSTERDLVIAMIVARIIDPRSKLATMRALSEPTATSSLSMELGIDLDDERALYAAMDWLGARQGRIETSLASKHLENGSLVLYDLSSSFYTGSHCSLAEFGYSRDGKNGYPQIVYGLLCTREGCPVAVEVFSGNTADSRTVMNQVEKIRERFHISQVILVGDRGMITAKGIRDDLRHHEGISWITALRSHGIRKLVAQQAIQTSLFDHRDLVEIRHEEYPGERLIVCRNPLLAEDRRRTREELISATEGDLDTVVAATTRENRRLRGKEKIALRVGRIIDRRKVGKHFILEITDDQFSYRRDEKRIAEEAALDGLYVIRTSVSEQEMAAETVVRRYKELSVVERAFRCLKTVDLKVRPIYHRREERVRAHVFLCMLAYYVEWHMKRALKPLLFEDEDPEGAEALRESIVAPARRSDSAYRKDATKRGVDGLPVQSFQSLLAHLGTQAKNLVASGDETADGFYMITQPTAIQRRAFELLSASP
ncbi:MAG: IS1634 family transposase [Spirochaetaceae bacterium]|nr:MAG: IS1634 family transposase [Spirochaetaceae bacterium]